MLEFTFTVEDDPTQQELDDLYLGLKEYNYPYLGRVKHEKLAVFLRDSEGEMVGGVFGATSLGWLEVYQLWVRKELRGRGHGRTLMDIVEEAAVARGCSQAILDTFSFQAPEFYQKLGYEVIASLDYSEHKRYFLKKHLS